MKILFKKTLGWLLVISIIVCSLVGTLTVSADSASDIHMQVDFLVRDKLGYSFYAYGAGLSEFDSLEIAVEYSYYDYDAANNKNYVLSSKTVVYEYAVGTVIEYDEIAAYEMMLGTTFTLNCYKGEEVAVTKSGTITYASLVYATMQAAEDKTVYMDMLNYGAAAQDYFASNNPGTDIAKNTAENGLPTDLEGIDAYQQYATSDEVAGAALATGDANVSVSVSSQIGAALQILSSNRLVFVVDPGANAVSDLVLEIYYGENVSTISVDSLELVGDYYYYYPSEDEAIALYDVKEVIYAFLYNQDEVVALKSYSIEAFVAESMMDGGKLEALGDALMKFAYSAKLVIFPGPKEYEGLTAVTEIEDGKSYYIVNKATGTVLTTVENYGYCWYTEQSYIEMGGEPDAYDTDNLWTFDQTGTDLYKVISPEGKYLKPNTMSGEVTYNTVENVINVYYDEYAEAWVIYRDFADYPDMYGPLQVVNIGSADGAPEGAIGAYNTVLGEDYTYWYIYEIDDGDDTNPDVDDGYTVTYFEEVTEIEEGGSYYIVNKATGTVLTTEHTNGYCWYSTNNYIMMGPEVTAEENDDYNLWTFTQTGSDTYRVISPYGRYLKPNTVSAEVFSYNIDVDIHVEYDEVNEGWVIYRDFAEYPDMHCPLQVVNIYTADGPAGGAIGADEYVLGEDYALWILYEVVTVTIPGDEIVEPEYSTTEDGFVYYVEDGEVVIYSYEGTDENVVIPEEIDGCPVTTIDYLAFCYCSDVVTVTIPNTVTYIGEGAFAYCEDLKEVNIPASVTTIADAAFAYCEDLTSITVPSTVTDIGMSVFAYCTHLTEVTYEASILPDGTFEGCTKLDKVYFSIDLQEIGEGAFYEVESLSDVYYEGTAEDLEYVYVGDYNDCLGNVTMHYNATGLPS